MSIIVRLGACLAFGLGGLGAPQTAIADDQVFSGITERQLEGLLSGRNLESRRDGDVVVLETGLMILATDCVGEAKRCNEIRFSRAFANVRPPLEAVNEWNLSYKIPEAAIDGQGRLRLEMWLSAIGMTDTIFFDTLTWFERAWETDNYWRKFAKPGAGT
jgi:hypothetical protein